MQNKQIDTYESNRKPSLSDGVKLGKYIWNHLGCCDVVLNWNINLPRSIPNPYLHVLHYALCFGRAHSRHSGDFSQLPVILVQDWFRWKIWKQIGYHLDISIYVDPEIHLLLNWGFFLGASGRESRIWVVDIYNFDPLKNHKKWMLPSWASIDYADDPSPRIFFIVTVTSQLFVDKNKPEGPWCDFCISEIWDSDLFHSPVWIAVMFCKDSPVLNYHLLCRLFRRSKNFSRPGIWRSKGCSEVKGWSK